MKNKILSFILITFMIASVSNAAVVKDGKREETFNNIVTSVLAVTGNGTIGGSLAVTDAVTVGTTLTAGALTNGSFDIFTQNTALGTGDTKGLLVLKDGSTNPVFRLDLNFTNPVTYLSFNSLYNSGYNSTEVLRLKSDLSAEFRGTLTTTDKLTVSAGNVTIAVPVVPANATATGVTGEVSWDATHIYICVGTDTWVRADIATW